MSKEIIEGIKGYRIWKKMTRNYDLDKDNFFLIYPGEEHLAVYINRYCYSYMYEFKATRCIFITVDQKTEKLISDFFQGNQNVDVLRITEKEVFLLLRAYWFKALGDKFMVISVENLYGRKLKNLIGINGITEEQLTIAALYNLKAKKAGKKCEGRIGWTFRVRT